MERQQKTVPKNSDEIIVLVPCRVSWGRMRGLWYASSRLRKHAWSMTMRAPYLLIHAHTLLYRLPCFEGGWLACSLRPPAQRPRAMSPRCELCPLEAGLPPPPPSPDIFSHPALHAISHGRAHLRVLLSCQFQDSACIDPPTPPATPRPRTPNSLVPLQMDILTAGRNYNKVRRAIVSGYFTHAAKKDPQEGYRTMVEGNPVYIHPSSALFNKSPEWVLYHELVLTTKVGDAVGVGGYGDDGRCCCRCYTCFCG